jgi:hypothetical protein
MGMGIPGRGDADALGRTGMPGRLRSGRAKIGWPGVGGGKGLRGCGLPA